MGKKVMQVPDFFKYYSVQLFSSLALATTRLFLPNLAKLLGTPLSLIGVISAASNVTVLASSFIFSRRTDIEGSKRYLHIGLLLSSVTVALLFFSYDYLSLLVTFALAGFAMGMYPATLVVYVFGKKVRLGKFSSLGSLGAGSGLLIAGYIAYHTSIQSVFIVGSIMFFIAFGVSLMLPPIPQIRHKVPFFPKELFKRHLPIFVPYLIRHLAANMVWIIYPLYLRSLGIDLFTISILYTINPFLQFVLMYTITDRISAHRLMALGLTFSAVAFFTMFLSSTPWHIIPVQIFIAASWSCLYVGALRQVTEFDVRKATSTGLLTSIINIGNIIGPLFGGVISEFTGSSKENMIVASLLSVASLPIYLRLKGINSKAN
jgi:MFS family permease